jgi:hypothetical protein
MMLDSPGAADYKRPFNAQVAQLVEHVTENHGVGGSIPPLGTISIFSSFQINRLDADFIPPSRSEGLSGTLSLAL